MEIEFDPDKDAANRAKHGVGLHRVVTMEQIVLVDDNRFSEPRVRLYGLIDGAPHCAAAAVRGEVVRIINLRRAHWKEYRRHAGKL